MRQNLKLLLAGFWLLVVAWLVYASYVTPDAPFLRLLGTDLPVVWLALALMLFNLLRWWLVYKQSQARSRPASPQRPKRTREEWTPPNPDFDFSERGP